LKGWSVLRFRTVTLVRTDAFTGGPGGRSFACVLEAVRYASQLSCQQRCPALPPRQLPLVYSSLAGWLAGWLAALPAPSSELRPQQPRLGAEFPCEGEGKEGKEEGANKKDAAQQPVMDVTTQTEQKEQDVCHTNAAQEPVVDVSVSTAGGRIFVVGVENIYVLSLAGQPQMVVSMSHWRGEHGQHGQHGALAR
jgi:hypothetical protein